MGDKGWGWGWGKPPMGKPSEKGESLVDVHNGLPKDIQAHIASRGPEAHDQILNSMKSMMPGERVAYGHSMMTEHLQGLNKAEAGLMGGVEK